ncbi:MAG: hypothetical protein AAAB21_22585, partial [Pseudomonas chlororaphis]
YSMFRWAQSDVESIHFASARSSICTLRLGRFATHLVVHAAIRHMAGAGWFFLCLALGHFEQGGKMERLAAGDLGRNISSGKGLGL